MKICIPTMGKKELEETVHNHFGSAEYFTIYDTENESVNIIENKNQHHNHGACQPLNAISDYKIDVILSSGMGRRAVQRLNDGGIKVYLSTEKLVKDAIEKFNNNELNELTFENACSGHSGCKH